MRAGGKEAGHVGREELRRVLRVLQGCFAWVLMCLGRSWGELVQGLNP